MITEDDSRQTLELADRYVIEPSFAWWQRDRYDVTGATPVAEGFHFASDINSDWLDTPRLKALIAEAH
jgi:UDP-N-acetylglucosamine 4,6-dehydratase